jgi:NADPH-dependent 2,4-dienoyl-CoA reductase/sulfur reductase-like enzyme/rhodanese-related sulfurtransferase
MGRTIVIVGGVAAGASAATRARRMDENARIILFEKDEHVSFANCGLPYHIGGEITDRRRLLVATPELLKTRFRIDVRTMTEVTAIHREAKEVEFVDHRTGSVRRQSYDKLILAPGASPIIPPMPGVDSKNVFVLRNLDDMDRIEANLDAGARTAVVVGAGFIGLEMAEQLRHRELAVTLVELQPQVLPPLDTDMASLVQRELVRNGVDLHLGVGIEAIVAHNGRAVAVRLTDGTELPADLVVLGMGVRPNVLLAEKAGLALGKTKGIAVDHYGRTSDPDIYAAGDAAEQLSGVTSSSTRIPLAGPANRAGRIAGQHAATGSARPLPRVMGSAIVRVFGTTAAATGFSEKACRAAGLPFEKVILEARHHAGYYPGAEAMLLKVLYAPESGKVLGAQAVGGQGVDKRIDVIATVLHFGGTVDDLASLDLTYAPPFGSAKDPIHMAGFMGRNELDGLVAWVRDDAELARLQVVDVRTKAETAEGLLPSAIAIPLDELRESLGRLDASKPTAVVCRSGLRAWVGARILKQNGFEDVRVLPGGMLLKG